MNDLDKHLRWTYKQLRWTRLGLQCQTPVWKDLGFSRKQICTSKRFFLVSFGPKTNIISKTNFCFQKFWVQKIQVYETKCCLEFLRSCQNLGPQKFRLQNKFWAQKIFWVWKNLWLNNVLGRSKSNFSLEKFWSRKTLSIKAFKSEKSLGQRLFFCSWRAGLMSGGGEKG